ncbi:hypothetical protein D0A64_16250 [Salmonella enterica]|nr:hypothetical protein [Salmonella enterica]EBL0521653.1 hypothetical protein [Salmonella enterica]EBM1098793.1 hypothetical protein [Salmonella enterica]
MHLYEIRIEKNLGTTAQKSLKTIQIDENLGTIKPALKSFQKTFKTGLSDIITHQANKYKRTVNKL